MNEAGTYLTSMKPYWQPSIRSTLTHLPSKHRALVMIKNEDVRAENGDQQSSLILVTDTASVPGEGETGRSKGPHAVGAFPDHVGPVC